MKISFLDADTLGNSFNKADFEEFGEVQVFPFTLPEQTTSRINNSAVIVTNKVSITAETLNDCPELKLICIAATGTDHVDTTAAALHGVIVKNAVNYSSDSVAEFALSLGLALKNQLKYYNQYSNSEYQNQQIFTHIGPGFSQLRGKQVGIIGLGNIGKKTAQMYAALGAQISYYSISQNEQDVAYQFYSELPEFLSTQDLVILHCPLTDASRDIINSETLSYMQQSAFLINVSRGAVVNEEDLVSAIENKQIAGAAIDVYAQEPINESSPYHRIAHYPNVLLTPHIAWGSDESRAELVKIIKQHITDSL